MSRYKSAQKKFESNVFKRESKSAQGPRPLPGLHGLERRRPVLKSGGVRAMTTSFNPVTSSNNPIGNAPSRPHVSDSLNPYRRLDSRNRDDDTIESRHREELAQDPLTFRRRKGEMQAYIDVAHSQSDILVWQSSQSRDDAGHSLLNALPTRPQSEVYDVPAWNLAKTSLSATSPFLAHRHDSAQLRRLRYQVNDPLTGTLQKPRKQQQQQQRRQQRPATTGGGGGVGGQRPLTKEQREARKGKARQATHDRILDFERKHHQKFEIEFFDKEELIELLEAEGLDVPGEMIWDNEAGVMRKEICRKQVYVDYCKRELFAAEPKPLVRAGKRLRIRECYCVVDFFKAAHGAVRVQAYDDQDNKEYQLLLIPNMMLQCDLEPPPASSDPQEWHAWSALLLPRLELTEDGVLQVGDPPLQENGLPAHFTLGASASRAGHGSGGGGGGGGGKSGDGRGSQSRANTAPGSGGLAKQGSGGGGGCGRKVALEDLPPPDRMHVTLFFRSL